MVGESVLVEDRNGFVLLRDIEVVLGVCIAGVPGGNGTVTAVTFRGIPVVIMPGLVIPGVIIPGLIIPGVVIPGIMPGATIVGRGKTGPTLALPIPIIRPIGGRPIAGAAAPNRNNPARIHPLVGFNMMCMTSMCMAPLSRKTCCTLPVDQ
jgi:hypothetical protein